MTGGSRNPDQTQSPHRPDSGGGSGDASGTDARGRVLPFVRPPERGGGRPAADRAEPVTGLRVFSRDPEPEEDFRHRMTANAAALILILLLLGGGYWLTVTMAEMRKNQDCILSGRRNCAPITVPVQPN